MKPRAQRSGLLVKPVGDQVVVFDQSRQQLHVLSRTTALVWSHCDGQHTVAELIDRVAGELGAPVDENVITLALEQLAEARLLENPPARAPREPNVTRRDLLHMAGALAAGIMLPTITSCGVPTEPARASLAGLSLSVDNTTTTSTSATTPLNTTTSTTGTTPLVTTTTSTTATTPLVTTTTSTTATTPLFTTTTSTTATTPLFTTTTSTTSPPTTTTTSTTPAPKKVAMCHEGRTIMVNQAAVAAHLAHGDKLGRCP